MGRLFFSKTPAVVGRFHLVMRLRFPAEGVSARVEQYVQIYGCGSKIGTQNGILVNGTKD